MPKSTKSAKASTSAVEKIQEESSMHDESSRSDQEQDQEVFLQPSQALVVPNMFIPYIGGPKMDWTVNDGLYHRFHKWHLKCKNILECELVMLPERRQCKKVITWSGDFGMDQNVSCSLSSKELMLDTIWEKCEDFCKPQPNEVRARFDLLTSYWQGNKSVVEWYNAVQIQVALAHYPPRLPRYFTGTFFGSS